MSIAIRTRATLIVRNNSFPLKIRRMIRFQLAAKFKKTDVTQADYGLQGLDHILDTSKAMILRLAWGVLLIGCLAVCSFQTYTRFAYYYAEPVAVDVKIVEWDKLEFPSLTVNNLDQNGMMAMFQEIGYSHINLDECLSPVFSLLKHAKGKDVKEIWASLNTTKTIIGVKVVTRRKQPYKVKYSGEYGFMGTFSKYEIDERFPYDGMGSIHVMHFGNPTGACNSSYIGGTVQPLGVPSDHRTAWSFLAVTSIDFMYTLKKYEFVSSRQEPCTDLETFIQCQKVCRKDRYKKLPCRFPFMPMELALPSCIVGNETQDLFSKAVQIEIRANCKCTRTCQTTTYSIGMRFIEVNAERKTIYRLYYEHNRIITITERFAYDFISLLSDIGGNLGLCLGLSILSIFQIFQALIWKCTSYLKTRQITPKIKKEFDADPIVNQVTRIVSEEWQRYGLEKLKRDLVASSVAGLSTVLDTSASPIWRTIWLLAIVGSFGLCCIFLHIRLTFYLSDPTHMTMKVRKDDTVHFPSITICGYTPDMIKMLRMYAKKKKRIRKLSFSRAMYDWCPVKLANFFEIPRVSAETIWKMTAIQKQLNSSLDHGKLLLGFSFFTKYEFREVDLPEGRCVQFDAGKQIFLGSNTQFSKLTYETLWNSYSEEMLECDRNYYTAYLTAPDSPFHMNTRLEYPYGAATLIPLEYQKITLLNRVRNPCATTKEANECYESCFQKIFLGSEITCRLPYMPSFTNLTMCSNFLNALEADNLYKDLALRFDPLLYEDCGCIRRCDQTIMFYVPYSEPHPAALTMFTLTFFTNIQQHLIEEHSDSLSSVICDIGGNLGLVLGVSLLSLFDMLQSLISITFKQIFPKGLGKRQKIGRAGKTRQSKTCKLQLQNKLPLHPKINF